jgi:hypothetical protein
MYKKYNDIEDSEMEWKDSKKLQEIIEKKLSEEDE